MLVHCVNTGTAFLVPPSNREDTSVHLGKIIGIGVGKLGFLFDFASDYEPCEKVT